jgi:hypothetical protein
MLRLLHLVSHENRNAELSGEELVGVASPGTSLGTLRIGVAYGLY